MTMSYFVAPVCESTVFSSTDHSALPEILTTRQMVKMPRSNKREYTDSELSSVACMLAKLRRKEDVIHQLDRHAEPRVLDSESVLDRTINKLLDIL